MVSSKDHKQIYDENKGPNTGGMGTVSPNPFLEEGIEEVFEKEVLAPFMNGLKQENMDFRGVIFIGLMTFLIVVFQPGLSLKAVAFEAVSAFATCGTSLGITSQFNIVSKIAIVLLMYFGRLGPITFISLLNKGMQNDERVRYIEEKIIIG